jgi:peptidoglycan hydrolase CwlO-like protein
MKKQNHTQIAKANNQIHILKTTVKELQEQLASKQIALERRDRIVKEEVKRSKRLDEGLSKLRIELATLKNKWYVRWFG